MQKGMGKTQTQPVALHSLRSLAHQVGSTYLQSRLPVRNNTAKHSRLQPTFTMALPDINDSRLWLSHRLIAILPFGRGHRWQSMGSGRGRGQASMLARSSALLNQGTWMVTS